MANVGTLLITIDGNSSKLRRELRKTELRLRNFGSTAASNFKRFTNAIKNAKSALVLLGVAAAVSVGLAIRKMVGEFTKFEDALLDLQKVMTESEGSALQFVGAVDKLSVKFGKSSADILQGAANFKQAGFTVAEAFQLQEKALTAATISELNVIESSKILIQILKGFKAPASDAALVLDILNETSNKYATNLGELARGMADLSPIAKLMNLTFEETAGVLTPIIEVFGSGSEAAIAMKTSLLRLVSDQSKVIDTLGALGVAQRDANGQLRSGRDILFDVAERFTLLDKNQKVFVAGQLVGIRQAGRALQVFDNLNKVQAVTSDALGALGSAEREQAIRLQALSTKLGALKESFNNVARAIGNEFVPIISDAVSLLLEFIDSFRTGGNMRAFVVAARLVIGVIETLAKAFDKVARSVFKVRQNFDSVTGDPIGPLVDERLSLEEKSAIRKKALNVTQEFRSNLDEPSLDFSLGQGIRDKIDSLGEGAEDATEGFELLDKEIRSKSVDLKKMEGTGKQVFDAMKNATQGWANSFAGDLTDVLFGAELSFGKIFESFAKMITQMIIQLTIIKPLMEAVFGFVGGLGTPTSVFTQAPASPSAQSAGINPVVSSVLGFAEGGIVPGPLGAPVPAIVHGGEKIIPNGSNEGDSPPVVQNINISPGLPETVRAELSKLMPQIRQAAVTAVMQNRRRGGGMASAMGSRG